MTSSVAATPTGTAASVTAAAAAAKAQAATAAGTTTSGASVSDTSKTKSFASGDFQTFLTMLTAQIKNQDPLNPMDNAEFAVQLATFSGVEQQVRTNQLLEGLNSSGGLSDYADWIGREARSTAPALFTDEVITLEIAPDAKASSVILVARDSKGNLASSEEIGTKSGAIDWYGRDQAGNKLADGVYSFSIENWKDGVKLSTTKVESYSRIVEAESDSTGVKLVTASGTRITADEVSGLREPG